jgi:hypothetical protein
MLLEIGASQGQAALALAHTAFPAAAASVQRDLAGLDRLLVEVERLLIENMVEINLTLPYQRGDLIALIHEYEARLPVYHFDTYRLPNEAAASRRPIWVEIPAVLVARCRKGSDRESHYLGTTAPALS